MKRVLGIAMIAMMAITMLVSCNAEVRNDGMARITLGFGDDASKGLSISESQTQDPASGSEDLLSGYTWTYTAVPAAGELGYGKVEAETSLDDNELHLSYGSWTFTLYGYDSEEALVYYGTKTETIGIAEKTVVVNVDKLSTDNLPEGFDEDDLAPATIIIAEGGVKYHKDDVTSTQMTSLTGIEGASFTYQIKASSAADSTYTTLTSADTMTPGSYTIKVSYADDASNTSSDTITFQAKAGQTYTLDGFLVHGTWSAVEVEYGEVNEETEE